MSREDERTLGDISLSGMPKRKLENGEGSAPVERHAGAFAFQGLTAERQEALADRVEDPANPYVVLVGRPRLRVFLPSVNAMWRSGLGISRDSGRISSAAPVTSPVPSSRNKIFARLSGDLL